MTSCPHFLKSEQQNYPILTTPPTQGLLSLPSSTVTKIFHAFAPQPSHPSPTHYQNSHNTPETSSQCNHAWIRPAFQLASSNSHLYLLYWHAMYDPALDPHHHDEFLTTDCTTNCFTTLLSGLLSLTLVRRAATPIFDAQFLLQTKLPALLSQQPNHPPRAHITTKTFTAQNSTLCFTQLENLFNISNSFPSLQTLQLSNVSSRDNTNIWHQITAAWSDSLQTLSIDDTYCEFDHQCLLHIAQLGNLQRLVISSRAVRWINPLRHLTSLQELVLHNCTIHDSHILHVLSNMTHLRALDLTETCVTPNIVNSLPTSLVRFAGGDRDVHCGDEDHCVVQPGLPPIDVRQATLLHNYNLSDHHHQALFDHGNTHTQWRKIVVIQRHNLPNLKFLEWAEWRSQRQTVASLRFIVSQLESLCLCGPDYDDELCDVLLTSSNLKSLELYGCNITDATAYILSEHPFLEFINITNCKRITPRGLKAICTGRAARNETLESVLLFGHVQAPSDALSDLLEDHRDMFSDVDVNVVNDSDSGMTMIQEMSVDEEPYRDSNNTALPG